MSRVCVCMLVIEIGSYFLFGNHFSPIKDLMNDSAPRPRKCNLVMCQEAGSKETEILVLYLGNSVTCVKANRIV